MSSENTYSLSREHCNLKYSGKFKTILINYFSISACIVTDSLTIAFRFYLQSVPLSTNSSVNSEIDFACSRTKSGSHNIVLISRSPRGCIIIEDLELPWRVVDEWLRTDYTPQKGRKGLFAASQVLETDKSNLKYAPSETNPSNLWQL